MSAATRYATLAFFLSCAVTISGPFARAGGAGNEGPLSPISNDAMMLGNDFAALAAVLGSDNAKPGPRTVPGRILPVPTTPSPALRAQIAAPYRVPAWNANPPNADAWHALVARLAAATAAKLPALRAALNVTSETTTLGGVPAFRVAPRSIPESHRGMAVLAIHGGGFVYNPGEAGTLEAILTAGFGGYEVYAVDYRMAPDHPYPAANDDVMVAYKALLSTHPPGRIAVVGTSAGGGLALALCLRAKTEGVPLPAAVAVGTPDVDMTNAGDTFRTNEWLDNVLVSAEGFVSAARRVYVPAGHDPEDPQLSPIFGDFVGMPPTIVTSGTRDLLLSNAVQVHRKLRRAGVEAELQVFEGMSHAQYLFTPEAPETREVFGEIAAFFDRHWTR